MRKLTTGVAAALLALVVTGCGESGGGDAGGATTGSDTASEDTGAGSGGDAVAWADGVCAGMAEHAAALTTQPEIDQTNPQAAKEGLVTYLGTLSTSLDGMGGVIEDAGAPPVDGGEEAVQGFLTKIEAAKETLAGAQADIEAAPVTDPAAFQAAASSAATALGEMEDPMASLEENKELKAAYDEAPKCKELQGS